MPAHGQVAAPRPVELGIAAVVAEAFAAHVAALRNLFDSGATIVNVRSGQADRHKVIEFCSRSVPPHFAAPAARTVE